MSDTFDIAIIGAGIAGASLAAAIGEQAGPQTRVAILEAEEMPGYHSTGRSAAFWEQCYGGPDIVPLTLASGPYLKEHGFLTKRGALYLAREQDQAEIDAFFQRFADSNAQFEQIGRAALAQKVPGLRDEWDRAIWQPECFDIDVAGLHQHYLKQAKASGAQLRCNARVVAIEHGKDWELALSDGSSVQCNVLANAAGAWADGIAQLAGVAPLSVQPLRRTVAQLRVDPAPPADMPLCLDINGGFYFKPEHGRLWLSPHDETPSDPVDAAPEEFDVALAIDRMENVTTWDVQAVERKWAGLRNFAADRKPVFGFDSDVPNFFWFAGQGGFGIQTSPAAAALGAELLLGSAPKPLTSNLNAEIYSPARFR